MGGSGFDGKVKSRFNYQREMERLIEENCAGGRVPRLLLHSCCGPCSTYCLKCLSEHFSVTVLYYNPNIYPPEEFEKRKAEQERFISEFPARHEVSFVAGEYEPEKFYEFAAPLAGEPEGGRRCLLCYELRLREAAEYASARGFDFFATTLTISPQKSADCLNEIGARLSSEYGVRYLCSDFKKRGGYQQSIEMSREYGLYRQNYCGCIYSARAKTVSGGGAT
ncbi:MAG: epoxyqueuosine reductase QueH [Clostridiales bacterium]|nr:epoxyqueuosine reductase QueH [Clostridiales bacterium]